MPVDGTFPTATAQWEKRGLAQEVPVWDESVCIQCAKCVIVCPHAVIRPKVYLPALLAGAPASFKSCAPKDREWKGLKYTLAGLAEDCTGCGICVDVCPARNKSETKLKAINMRPAAPLREAEKKNWEFFLEPSGGGPPPHQDRLDRRSEQFQRPLFEFSGACAWAAARRPTSSCSASSTATACSSPTPPAAPPSTAATCPTTPWAKNDDEAAGPAWANSLFEDNAEFGLGMRLSADHQTDPRASSLTGALHLGGRRTSRARFSTPTQKDEADIHEQRERVAPQEKARRPQGREGAPPAGPRRRAHAQERLDRGRRRLGLRHRLRRPRPRAGQRQERQGARARHRGLLQHRRPEVEVHAARRAVAKFSSGGNPAAKKDLGLMAMSYGNIYVASVAMGARDEHTLKAFLEAEAYDGPALIIAYSHCIAHGIDMRTGMQNQKAAADAGKLLLYRYSPTAPRRGEAPLILDSKPTRPGGLAAYMASENRFQMLAKSKPAKPRPFSIWRSRTHRRAGSSTSTSPGASRARRPEDATMDLSTTYLGLKLRTPLVCSASPLSETARRHPPHGGRRGLGRRAEFSLRGAAHARPRRPDNAPDREHQRLLRGAELFSRGLGLPLGPGELPQSHPQGRQGRAYPDHRQPQRHLARRLDELRQGHPERRRRRPGAQHLLPPHRPGPSPGAEVEQTHVDILSAVRSAVSIPVAVKLAPFFSNMASMAKSLDDAGAGALVLFNRFYQPDFDLERLEVRPNLLLSTPQALRLPLHWTAVLSGRIKADLAATSGIHTAMDVLKLLMAGATTTMLCSALYKFGIEHIKAIETELVRWMEEREYVSGLPDAR